MSSKPKNFSQALEELESLTQSAGADLKQKIQDELHDLEDKIHKLRPQLDELKSRARDEAYKAKDQVETQVKQNPWTALGVVGLLFFVLGLIFAGSMRRRD